MIFRYLLVALGLAVMAAGVEFRSWAWLLLWPGANLLVLGVAHFLGFHSLFGKRPDGTLPWWSWVIFFPLLTSRLVLWHVLCRLSDESPHNIVTPQLIVGRRQRAGETEGEFDNYVDLTAEFVEPAVIRRQPGYWTFPILDHSAPTPAALRQAVERLRPGRTFIHCAQGHGRAGLFTLAVLISSGMAKGVDDGLRILKAARPGIHLSPDQRRCIQIYLEQEANYVTHN